MAQFAVLIYAADSAHRREDDADPRPDEAATRSSRRAEREQCDEHADDLTAEGTMTHAWALTPRHEAHSIRRDGIRPGPFVEGAEVVAGFYLLEAPDLESALAIAARNPAVAAGGGVEVRPVHSGGPVLPRER